MSSSEKKEQALTSVEALTREVSRLRRKLNKLERDQRFFAFTNEKFGALYSNYQKEKKFYYLQNELLIKNTPNMVVMFDRNLYATICSSQCVSGLGFNDANEIVGLPLEKVFSNKFSSNWVNKITLRCHETMTSLKPFNFNDEIYRGSSYFYGQITISPIISDESECLGTVISITDSTELTHLKQRAEEVAEAKTAFLASMSHEIRTPMNAIKGLSELLLKTNLTPQQRDYASNVVISSNSLLHIINDILDFSKIDADKMEVVPINFELSKLIQEVVSLVSVQLSEKKLTSLTEIDPSLPSVLKGDETRIKQVILNLLSNAVKYTPSGYIKLSIKKAVVDGKDMFSFIIEDSGTGIKAEDIDKIFDAFSRVDIRINRAIKGTGLGLAISKKLASVMGGNIAVSSSYGQGSTFNFSVPLETIDSKPLVSAEELKDVRVLLLDSGIHAESTEKMLHSLNISFQRIESEDDLIGTELEKFTHCLCFPDTVGDLLENFFQNCTCKVIMGVGIDAVFEYSLKAHCTLFEPLLITQLVQALRSECDNIATSLVNCSCSYENVNVLIVDDNAINLIVGEELLKSYNINVTTANSGNEAVALCVEHVYDLIFMDHIMPEMDGMEATQLIRSFGLNRETPIIALTANVVQGMREQYLYVGMLDCLSKPIDVHELESILNKWVPCDKIKGI